MPNGNNPNPEDIINTIVNERKIIEFDPASGGVVYHHQETTSKIAGSEVGTQIYIGSDTIIGESGIEIEAGDQIFFCAFDNKINRLQDGFFCKYCRRWFHVSHLGYEEKNQTTRNMRRTFKDGTTQEMPIVEKIHFCKTCYFKRILPKTILLFPFVLVWKMLLIASGRETEQSQNKLSE